jgi:hypothetical protein
LGSLQSVGSGYRNRTDSISPRGPFEFGCIFEEGFYRTFIKPAQLALGVSAKLLGCLFDAQDGGATTLALEREEAMSLSLLQELVA